MESAFDPYEKWLGIPPQKKPVDHYRILGVKTFEDDPARIEAAATRRFELVQDLATGAEQVALTQELLNRITQAKLCLLDDEERRRYNERLKQGWKTQWLNEVRQSSAPSPGDAGTTPGSIDVADKPREPGKSRRKKWVKGPTATVVFLLPGLAVVLLFGSAWGIYLQVQRGSTGIQENQQGFGSGGNSRKLAGADQKQTLVDQPARKQPAREQPARKQPGRLKPTPIAKRTAARRGGASERESRSARPSVTFGEAKFIRPAGNKQNLAGQLAVLVPGKPAKKNQLQVEPGSTVRLEFRTAAYQAGAPAQSSWVGIAVNPNMKQARGSFARNENTDFGLIVRNSAVPGPHSVSIRGDEHYRSVGDPKAGSSSVGREPIEVRLTLKFGSDFGTPGSLVRFEFEIDEQANGEPDFSYQGSFELRKNPVNLILERGGKTQKVHQPVESGRLTIFPSG